MNWNLKRLIYRWSFEYENEMQNLWNTNTFLLNKQQLIVKYVSVDCSLCENLSLALLQITNRNYVGSYVPLKKLNLVPKNFNSVPKKSI